jgi:hypothetical protein
MSETVELFATVDRLRDALDQLVMRGLRMAGPDERSRLGMLRDEMRRIGADHLAEKIGELDEQLANDDRKAAATLMGLQARVRLLERLLTLRVVESTLAELDQPDEQASGGGES